MYKDKQFRVRREDEVTADLEEARRMYRYVRRVFLADGDALVLKTEKLARILDKIAELFPECERVGIYASPRDVLAKTPEELAELKKRGIGIAYIGAESGSDTVLAAVDKGATRQEIISAVRRVEESGIAASVTFISGLGEVCGCKDHALSCATLITEASPSYVGFLTLTIDEGAPLYADFHAGRFQLLSPTDTLDEMLTIIERAEPEKPCVFRSNHASNYLAVGGVLPQDKAAMAAGIRDIMQSGTFRPRRYRMF
jgi:biotin synthase-like enzyme